MSSILFVCTGNVCRSPIAEGMLREALAARLGADAPLVSSAGTSGWEGSPAMSESVQAGAERGVDISSHVARELTPKMLQQADLVVGLAVEHRDAVAARDAAIAERAFTLKELVRLLEGLPPVSADASDSLPDRVAQADRARRDGAQGNRFDESVSDPLGMPIETYRAVAWELDGWITRLAPALYGEVPRAAEA
jgi:protein-tyrosine phosphatase